MHPTITFREPELAANFFASIPLARALGISVDVDALNFHFSIPAALSGKLLVASWVPRGAPLGVSKAEAKDLLDAAQKDSSFVTNVLQKAVKSFKDAGTQVENTLKGLRQKKAAGAAGQEESDLIEAGEGVAKICELELKLIAERIAEAADLATEAANAANSARKAALEEKIQRVWDKRFPVETKKERNSRHNKEHEDAVKVKNQLSAVALKAGKAAEESAKKLQIEVPLLEPDRPKKKAA